MKKICIYIICLFAYFVCEAQTYPIPGNIGGPTTLVKTPNYGGLQAGLIPFSFADTSSANAALTYGKNYNGFIIYTQTPQATWWRLADSSKWVMILPQGGGTPISGQAWINPGNSNLFTDASLNGGFGTLGPNGVYIKTNGITRLYLDRNGIAPETGTSVGIGIDPADSNRVTYFSGGGGATPTWQQTLTAGSTLTGANTIAGGGYDFTWGNTDNLVFNTVGSFGSSSSSGAASTTITNNPSNIILQASTGSGNSFIKVFYDTIRLDPHVGNLLIDTLANLSAQNTLMGWTSTSGANRGKVGYITIGSGLSLSSGVLSNSGVVTTPTWQQTLTAGSTLTGANTITGGGYNFTWNNIGVLTLNGSTNYPAKFIGTSGGGVIIGALNSTYGGVWANNVSPSTSNYTLGFDGSGTVLNGVGGIDLSISSQSYLRVRSNGNVGISAGSNPSELLSLGTSGTIGGVLSLAGSTSGKAIIQTSSAAGTPTLTLPTTTGTLALTSDIPAAGANTALSNLSSVAINTSLLPGVTNSIDAGSSSFTFRSGYFGTSVFSPIVYGGSSSGGNLTIQSTSNGTKGKIFFGATSYVDEANTKNYLTGTTDVGGTAYGDASVILSLNNQTGAGTILGAYTSGAARFSIDQNGNTKQENGSLIGSASGTRDASSILEVRGTTGGVLMPRMTATQASAIGSPADGLIVYVTDTNGTFTAIGFWGRVSGAWTQL